MTSMTNSDEQLEAQARQHVVVAERLAETLPGINAGLALPLKRVAIIGGGLMGSGIAASCLRGGLSVTLIEQDVKAVAEAGDRVAGLLDGAVKRRKMTVAFKDEQLARLTTAADMADAAGADLAIEAIVEDLSGKRAVFQRLNVVLGKEIPLATNTSYLDPVQIADGIDNPDRILGLHFFSPAHVMKLLEVVRTSLTSDRTLATAWALARRLGKVAVLAGICDGFIGNRMLQAYRRQADYMLVDGCLPHEIDQAMRAFGMPMGPYELQDLTGLQIGYANRRRLDALRDPGERYVAIGDQLYEAGRLGQRAGKGWYRYEPGDRTPHRDDSVEVLIDAASTAAGVTRRSLSTEDIQNRLLAVLINEGGHILDGGIARQAADIDLVKIHGYGFPKSLGGPMFHGARIGYGHVRNMMQAVIDESPGSWHLANHLRSDPSRT